MIKKETFLKTLKKIMKHSDYSKEQVNTEQCNKVNRWTPCDLIIREELNNGSGSAKGFLGIGSKANQNAFEYIKENKNYFIQNNLINKDGYNNFGFNLWKNYDF